MCSALTPAGPDASRSPSERFPARGTWPRSFPRSAGRGRGTAGASVWEELALAGDGIGADGAMTVMLVAGVTGSGESSGCAAWSSMAGARIAGG